MKVLEGLKKRELPKRVVICLYLNSKALTHLDNVTKNIGCSNAKLIGHFSKLDANELSKELKKNRRRDGPLNKNEDGDKFSINVPAEIRENLQLLSNKINTNLSDKNKISISRLVAMLLDLANREL